MHGCAARPRGTAPLLLRCKEVVLEKQEKACAQADNRSERSRRFAHSGCSAAWKTVRRFPCRRSMRQFCPPFKTYMNHGRRSTGKALGAAENQEKMRMKRFRGSAPFCRTLMRCCGAEDAASCGCGPMGSWEKGRRFIYKAGRVNPAPVRKLLFYI